MATFRQGVGQKQRENNNEDIVKIQLRDSDDLDQETVK